MRVLIVLLVLVTCSLCWFHSIAFCERPNIVWIVVEDMSCHFGYQGERSVRTPHVDRLAGEGVVFQNAYVTAPVCSASRSALITGMYQTTIGAHHHRSSRGKEKIQLPDEVRTVPELLRDAGYYTCNFNYEANQPERYDRPGKEDYNFVYNRKSLYDASDWSGRAAGQPFYAQVQLRGGKLRNVPRWYREVVTQVEDLVTAGAVTLPPYYPDDPVFRKDWAEYLNSVQYTDYEVGLILARLEQEDLLDSTVIFFLTDHGVSQARGKQFLYDEGSKVPLIAWSPTCLPSHQIREDLVAHIDVAASTLELAKVPLPEQMQAKPLFGSNATPREFVVSARDRCDETFDRIRSVRQGRYKYIRNYYPQRPYLQPCAYKDHKPFMASLRSLYEQGLLNQVQSLHLAENRPEEELYDLVDDPFEVKNLAGNSAYQEKLGALRQLLHEWEQKSNDQGRFPESAAMYDSDMKVYVGSQRRHGNLEYAAELEENISLMKQWQAEGR